MTYACGNVNSALNGIKFVNGAQVQLETRADGGEPTLNGETGMTKLPGSTENALKVMSKDGEIFLSYLCSEAQDDECNRKYYPEFWQDIGVEVSESQSFEVNGETIFYTGENNTWEVIYQPYELTQGDGYEEKINTLSRGSDYEYLRLQLYILL